MFLKIIIFLWQALASSLLWGGVEQAVPRANEEIAKELKTILKREGKFVRFTELQILAQAHSQEQLSLVENPFILGQYVDFDLLLLEFYRRLYFDDLQSQQSKELFSQEKNEYFGEGLLDLNFPRALTLLADAITQNGASLLQREVSVNQQVDFLGQISWRLHLMQFSPLNQADKSKIAAELEQKLGFSSSLRGRELSMGPVCKSVELNPYPLLRQRNIQLTSAPLDLGPLSYVTGVDQEQTLWFFVFYRDQIISERPLVTLATPPGLFGRECPHLMMVGPGQHEVEFFSENLVFTARRDGRIKKLAVYNGNFNDARAFERLQVRIEKALSSQDQQLQIQALAAYGNILQNTSDPALRKKICELLIKHYLDKKVGPTLLFQLAQALGQGGAQGIENLIMLYHQLRRQERHEEGPEGLSPIKRAVQQTYTRLKEWPIIIESLFSDTNEDSLFFGVSVIGFQDQASKLRKEAMGLLQKVASHRGISYELRSMALAGLGGPDFSDELTPYLSDFVFNERLPVHMRQQAIRTLSSKNSEEAMQIFNRLRRQKSPSLWKAQVLDYAGDFFAQFLEKNATEEGKLTFYINQALALYQEILPQGRGFSGLERSLEIIFRKGQLNQALLAFQLMEKFRPMITSDDLQKLFLSSAHKEISARISNILMMRKANELKMIVATNFFSEPERIAALQQLGQLPHQGHAMGMLQEIILAKIEDAYKFAAVQIFISRARDDDFAFLNEHYKTIRPFLIQDQKKCIALFLALAAVRGLTGEQNSAFFLFLDRLLSLPGYIRPARLNLIAQAFVNATPAVRQGLIKVYRAHIPPAEKEFWDYIEGHL